MVHILRHIKESYFFLAKKKRKRRRPPSNPTSQSSPPSSLELPHKKPNETMQADLPVVTQNYDPRFGYIENLATSNQADPVRM